MKKSLILLLLITSSAAAAQEKLGLSDAIDIALRNSLDIQLAENNLEVNTVLDHIGVAGGLPTVTGFVSNQEQLTSVNQKLANGTEIRRNAAFGNSLNANVTGELLLYNGKRVVATKQRLEQLRIQSEQDLNVQVQNTIASVMTTYYDIVRQQSYATTISQSISVSEKRLEILQARQSAGLANDADIFQARIDLNALQQANLAQQLVIEVAKADLLTLLTLNPDSSVVIQDSIVLDESLQLEEVLNNIRFNPSLLAAEQQIQISELITKEVAAQRYPSLSLRMGLNYNRIQNQAGFNLLNQSGGPNVALLLSVPIYNGGVVRRQEQVAKINVNSALIQKDILTRDFQSLAVKTYRAYQNALVQLNTERENYALSQRLLNLTLQRFELRQATIIEVREAQQSFEAAGYRLVNLSYAAKAAEIELKRLANGLGG